MSPQTSDLRPQTALLVILGRGGSKGLPQKNTLPLAGKPMVAWTIEHALAANRADAVVVSTDSDAIAAVACGYGLPVIERPAELASDTATVDSAARHAVEAFEKQAGGGAYDAVVILYANVPLRPADLTDRALEKLAATGCDSVQSVCPVGKMHPFWMKKLGGPRGAGMPADALLMYEDNRVYRRQDLPPVYMLDGGVIAVTRRSLFTAVEGEPHAFLGTDRRAIVTQPGEVVDVDSALDLKVAEAIMTTSLEPQMNANERK